MAPEVGTIYYEGGKTISKKLHRVKGANKWDKEQQAKERAFNQKTEKANSNGLWGYLETFKSWLMPAQTRFTNNMENKWNLLYLGGIYIGTPNDGGS